jgi:hypothetical protein
MEVKPKLYIVNGVQVPAGSECKDGDRVTIVYSDGSTFTYTYMDIWDGDKLFNHTPGLIIDIEALDDIINHTFEDYNKWLDDNEELMRTPMFHKAMVQAANEYIVSCDPIGKGSTTIYKNIVGQIYEGMTPIPAKWHGNNNVVMFNTTEDNSIFEKLYEENAKEIELDINTKAAAGAYDDKSVVKDVRPKDDIYEIKSLPMSPGSMTRKQKIDIEINGIPHINLDNQL